MRNMGCFFFFFSGFFLWQGVAGDQKAPLKPSWLFSDELCVGAKMSC